MVAAVNSKHHRFEPRKYMMQANLRQQAQREEKPPMTGDQVFAAFERMGVPMISLQ